MEALTQRSFKAFIWNASGQVSVQLASFAIGIMLARILSPDEYGAYIIALLFSGISTVFMDGGLGTAIIRKQNVTDADLSTAFYFNILVSLLLYLMFYFLAPGIAAFFNQPDVVEIIRVVTLTIIITSFSQVPTALLIKKLDYKSQSIFRIISVIISGISGIICAYRGFGVWSLVVQNLLQNAIWLILIWLNTKWRPRWLFSFGSFKELFSFGSKLMLSGISYQIFSQSYNFIIGKLFPAAQLSYYNRAESYQRMSSMTITNMVNSVVFPSLSEIQNDDERLRQGIRKIIRLSMFFTIPLMLGILLLAEPLIVLLITDKWLPVVPILQWLCVAGIFHPIQSIIMNIFNVKGRSDQYFYVVIIYNVAVIIAIFIGYQWSLMGIVISQTITSFAAFLLCGYFAGKKIGLTLSRQILDVLPFFILSVLMLGVGYFVGYFIDNLLLKTIIIFISCSSFYLITSYVFKLEALQEIRGLILGLKK